MLQLLATVILSHLRFHHGNFAECDRVVSSAYDYLVEFIHDSAPIVLKSVCEAMKLCLPMLLMSTQPIKGKKQVRNNKFFIVLCSIEYCAKTFTTD